jgi:hypothetical protein
MRLYQILQATTGAILWTGGALTEDHALEIMAHAAGYRKFQEIPPDLVGPVSISEVSF